MKPARVWCVLPASGVGARFGGGLPKQYADLANRPVIFRTLDRLTSVPGVAGVKVVLRADDHWWEELLGDERWQVRVSRTTGGRERAHSVLHALDEIRREASDHDWALVHDAVRPCVRASDILYMVEELAASDVGGLLATPVRDTMKRSNASGEVIGTVDREHLWHAMTPQMFRLGLLHDAMKVVLEQGLVPTDEAQVMESAGHRPQLIEGSSDNIKITRPADLGLARLILAAQKLERGE